MQRDVHAHEPDLLLREKTLDLVPVPDPEAQKEEIPDLDQELLLEKKLSFTLVIFLMIPLKERFTNSLSHLVRLILWLLSLKRMADQKVLASSFTKIQQTTKLP